MNYNSCLSNRAQFYLALVSRDPHFKSVARRWRGQDHKKNNFALGFATQEKPTATVQRISFEDGQDLILIPIPLQAGVSLPSKPYYLCSYLCYADSHCDGPLNILSSVPLTNWIVYCISFPSQNLSTDANPVFQPCIPISMQGFILHNQCPPCSLLIQAAQSHIF